MEYQEYQVPLGIRYQVLLEIPGHLGGRRWGRWGQLQMLKWLRPGCWCRHSLHVSCNPIPYCLCNGTFSPTISIVIFHCNFVLRSDSVWGPFVSCPQETVMCGFQTKGYTAFPDNNEIFRVRSVLVMILMLEYRFNLNQQVLVLRPTSGPHSGPHCDLLADPRPPPILPQM